MIYKNEKGLQINFSRGGVHGKGLYFAMSADYSHDYSRQESDGCIEMFIVFVIQGNSHRMAAGDSNMIVPPEIDKSKSKTDRYDCVTNNNGHTIIFETNQQYPAYLIRYN